MFFNMQSWFLIFASRYVATQSQCTRGCDLALGSYYVWVSSNLTFISKVFNTSAYEIMSLNPENIPNKYFIRSQVRINIPFTCDCIDQQFLGHVFSYNSRSGDTYDVVANKYYSNLTTPAWVERFNSYKSDNLPLDARLSVTVNCSCGDNKVSKDYEVFITYPLRPGDSLESVAREVNFSSGTNGSDLLQRYNPGVNFSAGSGIVFVPSRDKNGNSEARKSRWLLTYISNLGVAFVMVIFCC